MVHVLQVPYQVLLAFHDLAHLLTGVLVMCDNPSSNGILVCLFWALSILARCYNFVSIAPVSRLPFYVFLSGGINNISLFDAVIYVRGVDVNWLHRSMMQVPMVFLETIRKISFSWFPKYVKNLLFDTVSYRVEPHVDCSRSSFITYYMHYYVCR